MTKMKKAWVKVAEEPVVIVPEQRLTTKQKGIHVPKESHKNSAHIVREM